MKVNVKKQNANIIKRYLFLFLLTLSVFISGFAFAFSRSLADQYKAVACDSLFVSGNGVKGIYSGISAPEGYFVSGDFSGVLIETKSDSASFSYKYEIDAKTVNKDTKLIELGFLGMGEEDYGRASSAVIYLTDAQNPKNRVGIGMYPVSMYENDDAFGIHTYFRVIYNDTSAGYDESNDRYWVEKYGTGAYQRSLFPGNFFGRTYPIVLRFDYSEKAFYVDTHIREAVCILDLDDPLQVGEAIWQGFESDRFILSMEITYLRPKQSGVIVSKLLGRNLSGEFIDVESNIPSVTVIPPEGQTLVSLPKAQVNTAYKLQDFDVFDFVYGTGDITVSASINGKDISDKINDGYITVSESGTMSVNYTATNADGNSNSQTVNIEVVNELPPYIYSKSSDRTPKIGEYFDIPYIRVLGGSGTLIIEETADYNGKSIDLNKSRRVFINEAGIISLGLTVKGYTGTVEKTTFVFSATIDKAAIVVNAVPCSVMKGKMLVLPDCEIIQKDGTQNGKRVIVNNTDITDTLTYQVVEAPGSVLDVKYCGGSGDSYSEVCFAIDVLDNTYSLSDFVLGVNGNVNIYDSEAQESVIAEFSEDASFRFAYPVSMDNLNIEFYYDGSFADSLDIVFNGYQNRSETMFIRISYCDATTSYVTVNGEGKIYKIPVGFTSLVRYNFTLENSEGLLYFGNKVLCSIIPFENNCCILNIRANGVTAQNTVYIKKISNQSFNPGAFIIGDKVAPVLSINGVLSKDKQVSIKGANYTVPSASAFDVLSSGATVSLKIVSQAKTVYNGSADSSVEFKVDDYGLYVISYIVMDAKGNKATYNFYLELIDKINPELTVLTPPKASYKVNDVIKVSEVNVSDNYDESPAVAVFLLNNKSMEYTYYQVGDSIKLNKAGSYTLIYRAYDADYNMVYKRYVFKVED